MDKRDLQRNLHRIRARADREFEALAGSDLPKILSSKAVAETYLAHADKSRRLAAIWALTFRLAHDESTGDLFKGLVLNDPDTDVRAVAAANLGTVYYRTSNRTVGKFLATIVRDNNQDAKVREGAYRALYSLLGTPVYEQPPLSGFDFLRDVDWTLVAKFFEEDQLEQS